MTHRVQLTIPSGKVASNLTSFVVRVNLADITQAAWWAACTGSNIRVKQAGTDVPFDVVWIDTTAKTGELFFKASLLTASDNTFTVEAVTGATAPAVTDPIGRNAVWSDYDVMVAGGPANTTWMNRVDGTVLTQFGTGVVGSSDGWLDFGTTANSNLYLTGVPLRTQFTLACSSYSQDNNGNNKSCMGISNASGVNSNRLTVVDNNGDTRGLWDSTDGFRLYGAIARNVSERRMFTLDGTTQALIYLNGALVLTDAGIAARPTAGPCDFIVAGGLRTSTAERWQGKLNYLYQRNGILSANWSAAEYASWHTPASFYTIADITNMSLDGTLQALTGDLSLISADYVEMDGILQGLSAAFNMTVTNAPATVELDAVLQSLSGAFTLEVTDPPAHTLLAAALQHLTGAFNLRATKVDETPAHVWPPVGYVAALPKAGPTYRYLLCDLLTDRPIASVPLSGVSFDRRISRVGSLQATLNATTSQLVSLAKVMYDYAGRSALWVYRDGEIWWGGIPWTIVPQQGQKDGITCAITAATFDSYAHHRELYEDATYTATDAGVIVPDLWRTIQTDPRGDIGVVAADQPIGVLRDRTYLQSDQAKVGQLIEDEGNLLDGPEHTIDTYLTEGGVRVKELRLAARLGSTDPRVVFTRATGGGGRVLEWAHTADATDSGTTFRSRGDTPDGTDTPASSDRLYADALLDAGWPLLDVSEDRSGITDVPTLNGWAETLEAQAAGSVRTSSYKVRVAGTGWSPNRLGDSVRIKMADAWHNTPEDMDQTVRPVGVKVTAADRDTDETVELLFGDDG